jgi:MYXO-CTERM domain-containing protein
MARNARWAWAIMVGTGFGLVASSAAAKATYKPAIPNAEAFNCDTCHIPDDPDDARNLFGQGFEALAAANAPLDTWWDDVKELDADGDGQSNAEELGDPCLEWTLALPAGRTFDISNPGDPLSLSPSPDVCEDPPMGEGGGGGGGEDGMGEGMGNGMGNGMGDGGGMGGGGAEPEAVNDNQPSDPTFTPAEPSGCASTTGRGSDGNSSWLWLAALGLVAVRRRT